MTELDDDEKDILEAYLTGRLEAVPLSKEELARYREAARATGRKDKRVNIRLSSHDFEGIQIKAKEEGMPYQTLIASVLHRYISGQLVAKG